jgi:predicted MPP superfamily phosphohydrolase
MTLAGRFWLAALVFHGALVGACCVLFRRWRSRAHSPMPTHRWLRGLMVEAAAFGAAAIALASLMSLVGPPGSFTVLRFLAQALFGEVQLLLSFLGMLLLIRRPRVLGAGVSAAALALLCTYVDAYHREPWDLQVRTHQVSLGRLAQPLRLLHLSDIQTDAVGAYEERVVREAVALKPDLVVITGDLVQPRLQPTRARANAALRPLLRRLAQGAPLGAYAVKGDVDTDWPRALSDTGVRPLTGDSIRIVTPGGRSLVIVGVTTEMSRGHQPEALLQLVRAAPEGDIFIVAGHNPNFVADLADAAVAVDLVLAGHTHGGQVVLPFFGPPFTKTNLPGRYASGLNDYRGLRLHVSAGIGMERGAAPQLRLFCPPEMCMLELR